MRLVVLHLSISEKLKNTANRVPYEMCSLNKFIIESLYQ